MTATVSAPRAIWLLARLKLLRLRNQTALIGQRLQKGGKSRKASAGKKRSSWVLGAAVVALMLFGFITAAGQAVLNLQCHLDGDGPCGAGALAREATEAIADAPFSLAVTGGLTFMLTLLLLVSFVIQVGNRDIAAQDWDLEWLVTLPLSRRLLLLARLCERSLTNAAGWLAFIPVCLMVAWHSGFRWSAPLLAVAFSLPLLMLAALCWTLIDTGLRLAMAPSAMRNLQAFISVLVTPLMLVPISFGASVSVVFQFAWARAFPEWMVWSPPGLVVQAINAHDLVRALWLSGLLLAEVALCMLAGLLVLQRLLRNGVVASGVRESGRRSAAAWATASAASATPVRHGWLARLGHARLSPVQRRELRLLSRDRNFLVQSLVVPVVILGSQLMFNGRVDSVAQLAASPGLMAALAFGLGVQVLMMSAMATLNREGGALWLLFTFPRAIEGVLKEKAQLWATLSLCYPLAVFATGVLLSGSISWQLAWLLLLVLLGLPIYAFIAVSLGVFATDPLAQDVKSQLRPTYVYLYLLLSSMYVYGLFAAKWWQSVVIVVLVVTLAYALWQKARDHMPYLLDPDVAPPARVSASDGLIAATLFFVLQGLFGQILKGEAAQLAMEQLLAAFAGAGLLTYLTMRYSYWRHKTQGVPTIVGARAGRGAALLVALRWGLGLGLLVALAGLGYVALLRNVDMGQDPFPVMEVTWSARLWLIALAVLAAPLCEEFIFRGLIFGGLRRSMGPWPAIVASALIFAIVHPPPSMLPVFLMGLAAGLAYERSKLLLAPMLLHATYNGAVITLQLFF